MSKESHYKKAYGEWAGKPKGTNPDFNRCAKEIWENHISKQCSRACGHGPDGAYCKQHSNSKR